MYAYSQLSSVYLRPTDEVGKDGWQFILFSRDLEMSKVAQSEELVFNAIASLVPAEITFNKLVWASDFRCVSILSTPVGRCSTLVFFRANIRMVNRFGDGRVFVAGGMCLSMCILVLIVIDLSS